jgi:hypothetical protein
MLIGKEANPVPRYLGANRIGRKAVPRENIVTLWIRKGIDVGDLDAAEPDTVRIRN